MMRIVHKGVTLIELLVALLIGSLAALVIQQVMAVFEGQKRTSGSGSDAQVNGAVALTSIEREVRQAGYGMLVGGSLMCPLGINIYFNGTTISNGGALLPIRITDGGAGPDSIDFVRSGAEVGALPTSIVKNMPNASSEVTADSTAGLKQTMLFVVGAADGSKICTLMQMSQDPQLTGNGWNLQHNSGQYPYNPPNPNNVFAVAPTYGIGDVVINMGSFIQRRFVISNERLTEIDNILGTVSPLVDQIIDLQAQYGIVNAGSQQIARWCDATATSKCGDWSNPSSIDIMRVRALRIAIVSRSIQYEKEMVSPANLTLWGVVNPANEDAAPVRALTDEQRHYRYKVYTTLVPIRNLIWSF